MHIFICAAEEGLRWPRSGFIKPDNCRLRDAWLIDFHYPFSSLSHEINTNGIKAHQHWLGISGTRKHSSMCVYVFSAQKTRTQLGAELYFLGKLIWECFKDISSSSNAVHRHIIFVLGHVHNAGFMQFANMNMQRWSKAKYRVCVKEDLYSLYLVTALYELWSLTSFTN